MIKANFISVPPSSFVHPTAEIKCHSFTIGENSYIGPRTKITCNKFHAGSYLYFSSDVEVGRGGCTGPNSHITIGDHVGVFENTVLNTSDHISIGNNSGIGTDVLIWTHGAWLDPLDGFPSDFGPVSIGTNVWVPARTIVLPNVTIGDNCVISTMSLVNRNIPPGSLAGGNPCKVIKKDYYPKTIPYSEQQSILNKIIQEWKILLLHKNIDINEIYLTNDLDIKINEVLFLIKEKKIIGNLSPVIEDFRDFLRRKGIKIYTGTPFKSLPAYYETTIV